MRPEGRQVLLDMVRSAAWAPVRVRGLVVERVQARARVQV